MEKTIYEVLEALKAEGKNPHGTMREILIDLQLAELEEAEKDK